jgi:hypothetical protein
LNIANNLREVLIVYMPVGDFVLAGRAYAEYLDRKEQFFASQGVVEVYFDGLLAN